MVSPLQNTLDVAVRAFVALASGLNSKYIIPGNDGHGSPNVPYATVLELTEVGNGIDSEVAVLGPLDSQHTLKQKGSRTIMYSVNFYKGGAADNAKSLLSFPSTTAGQFFLAENNLTWVRAGDVRKFDAVMGSKFEDRSQIDIELKYQSRRETVINNLNSVEIDFTLSAESDLTENIEVTNA